MSKFTRKLISPIEPVANASGIYSAVEQLQNLNALAITAVNFCADSSGTANGLNDDTAISTAGGFVKLTGSGFTSASIVYINGISVTKYYLSATTIVATVPAATSGTTASLIVFNGSTVGSIWAAGISYSGFPSWTTTAASNLGVVVSTQLVAVGDAPLVYTFVSGTLPPNCTISSSGLLSGTVTGVSTNAIYTFTVAVTDAQNQNVSQSIVYTLVVSDFYYRYTSLHISGDSNPTWITDTSTNALAVTPTGSPQATTFSPLEAGYYGNSFNGSSDWLSIPTNSTGLALGSGDFTIEAWVYKNASGSGTIFGKTAAINYAIDCYISNSSNYPMMTLSSNGTATTVITGGTIIASNRWYHAAYVRSGTTINIYINGVLDGTGVFSGAVFNAGDITVSGIGARPAGGAPDSWLNGCISNLRIVKGTAVYTANFTPSATPLTAITNTSLLTCQSNRFIDNSAAPATITVAGTPKVVSSNPFNLPAGLAAYGAGYFNGSSYLTVPSNAALNLPSGAFTIEMWIYRSGAGAGAGTYENLVATSSGATAVWGVYVNNSTLAIGFYNSSGLVQTSSAITNSTWTHIAISRTSGNNLQIFINGVSGYSASNTGTGTIVSTLGIAFDANNNSYYGYISNLRYVNGTTLYTGNFTPPTAPLTAVAGTSLLTLQTNVPHNNSQFRDTSTNNALITRYGNTTQGSFSPFTKQYPYSTATVGGSAYFDGTGDYLTLPASSATSFGTGDFTVEFWMNTTGPNSQMLSLAGGTAAGNWQCTLYNGNFYWQSARNTTDTLYVASAGITDSAWHHIAITRASNTLRIFFDGVQKGTVSDATNYNVSSILNIGYSSSYFGGYLSNIRLIAGIAAYTSNFTPSTAPLALTSNTTLLLPFTNAAVYDNTMLNNFETVGNAGVSTAVTKYGSASLKFNGTTDYLTIPANPKLAFGGGNFTIEGWVYANALGSYNAIIAQWPASNGDANNSYVLESVGSSMNFYWVSGVTLYGPATLGTITTGEWIHYAICRSGNTLYPFKNGVLGTTVSITQTLNSPTSAITVGGAVAGSGYWNGHIDELRVTKGYARYTAAFTPSTGAYSVSAPFGTSTLPSKSLRFRSSASAYLNRTFAAGNRTTWTWSGWIKRGKLGAGGVLFQGYSSIGDRSAFQFNSSDQLFFNGIVGILTTAVFRDPAAWYHMVCVYDSTNATDSNRVILYVNGVRQTVTGTYPTVSQAEFINGAWLHYLSTGYSGAFEYTDGEMAEVNFVDGLALEPTMFGAYSTYGQWLPISYAGYQGANGFYLPFNAATTTTSANYLVVAGGGGGGTYGGGGGGAGGLRTVTGATLDPTTVYAVTVGAGGTGPSALNVRGGLGGDSNFNSLTSTGGGGGGTDNLNAGTAGGSGGGAALSYNTTYAGGAASPVTSPVQGYTGAGTTASGGSFYNASGGGGGAGAAGTTGSTVAAGGGYGNAGYGTSGNGGAGVVSSISGTSVTYAGGGGGGGASTGAAWPNSYYVTAGTGGAGGGGNGTMVNSRGIAGTANLGGGGGGGGMYAGGITGGGAGGSGVVIISYSGTQKFYGGNVTSVGGNTIHTFTTSGSLTGIFGDQSGNNNNWTPNNINVSTPGPTYDLLTDVPTLTSATAANYAVLNPLEVYGMTLTDGNLKATAGTTAHYNARSTIYMPSSGKWYFEGQATSVSNPGQMSLGLVNSSIAVSTQAYAAGYYSIYFGFSGATTNLYINNNGTSSSANSISAAISDITQVAYDATTGKLWLGYNNSWKNSSGATDATANPGTGTNPTMTISTAISLSPFIHFYSNSGTINFGQQPWTYTPPANFLALNTYNI